MWAVLLPPFSTQRRDRGRSSRLEEFCVHLPDRFAITGHGAAKLLGRIKSTSDRNTIKRRGISGEHGFALIAPAPKNCLDTTKRAVILDQPFRVSCGKNMLIAHVFEGAHRVWFAPPVFKRGGLCDEFRVDQTT